MSEYSVKSYRKLLSGLQMLERPFVRMAEIPTEGLILRHDVDYSPSWAGRVAEIDAELGIVATFFFLVDSPLYNLFSPDTVRALDKIAAYGQDIGLHFSCRESGIEADELQRAFEILRVAVPSAKRCVAWHNPVGDIELLNGTAKAADFICAYDVTWYGSDRYIADSNLRCSSREILDFVKTSTSPRIQVLLHPFNWVSGSDTMRDVLTATLRERLCVLTSGFKGNRVWREDDGLKVWSRISNAARPPWWGMGDAG